MNHAVDGSFSYDNDQPTKNHQEAKINARLQDNGGTFLSVPQASVTFDQPKYKVEFGRFPLDWAPLDDIWGTGIINNRQNFNLIHPDVEGLFGVNFKLHVLGSFIIEGFGSFLYLPELNPAITEKNKKLSTKSQWAELPPTATYIENGGTKFPINYTLNKPNLDDFIFKPSYGLGFGLESEHWIGKGYYLRKPENTFRVQATVSTNSALSAIDAQIYPELYNENIFTGHLGYRHDHHHFDFMLMTVVPESTPQSSTLVRRYLTIETRKEREEYMMAGFSRNKQEFNWGVYYLHLYSGSPEGNGTLGNKPRWSRAVKAFLDVELVQGARFYIDTTYDVARNDTVLDSKVSYLFVDSGILAAAGIQAISAPKDNSYWASFRANDTFYFQLGHVF